YRQAPELAGHALRLLSRPVPGQVAGNQQHVGALTEAVEGGPEPAEHVPVHVHISHRGDPDHVIASGSPGGPAATTAISLCTNRCGNSSATRRPISARRSSLSTEPRSTTRLP